MLRFSIGYFAVTVLLLIIEILIAVFVTDNFVRPYLGDFLVVILIYCFVMSFLNIEVVSAAVAVLLFSYLIETTQYFKLLKHLGLQKWKVANVMLGNSFSWNDILAYTLGVLFVYLIEFKRQKVGDEG